MKIKEILSQNRRDFTAMYECEAGQAENYRALTTRHAEGETV